MRLLIRWIFTSLALVVAAQIVPGIRVGHDAWTAVAVMALVLGLINVTVRPILKLLSCPLIILTLGLFALIINAIAFLLASSIAVSIFHVDFRVDGLVPAFWGALIVSIVSILTHVIVQDV